MLDEIKEIENLLACSDYRWCQWSDSSSERLTGQKGEGSYFYRPLLEERLREIENSPVTWAQLIEVLKGFKFNV